MHRISSYILGLLFLLSGVIYGQGVSFEASAKNVVRTNERFQLTYTLNAEGSSFRGPAISNFQVLGGPSTSTNSSIQIINGSVSRTVEYSFTYILQAGEEGIFEIQPATITVDGKTITSNALKIQVVGGGSQQNSNQQGAQGNISGTSSTDNLKDDVLIRAVTDNKNPMQGEQVIVTYKLYYRINISSPQFDKEPSFKGFWVEDLLKGNQNYVQYQEVYNGQNYHVAELKKVALFPQQSGKIELLPLELSCQAQVQSQASGKSRDPFDSFFNDPFFNRYKTVELSVKSNSLTINVQALPTANQPANFGGAVGNFKINTNIDKTSLKANEAINLKFTISGTGNVELVNDPLVKFPPDFEIYDPKISKNINANAKGVISGTKSFEYLVIPRTPGDFHIDPVSFVYFDLNSNKYVTLNSNAFDIHVDKGTGNEADVTYSNTNQSDIRYIGSDIRHIHTGMTTLLPIGSWFFGSTTFYLLLASPFILFLLFIIIWKKELKKRSNMALMRNRKATRVAQKRLKKAHTFMKENNKSAFYEEISQALWGYLSDKFSIPLVRLSIDTVEETLKTKQVNDETIHSFIETLNNCEYARFAPGESNTAMENIYNQGMDIISRMERNLK